MKLRFASLLIPIAVLAGCGVTATSIPPAATQAPSASPSASDNCDASLWDHVYHPDRLKVVRQCMTVTGIVDRVKYEPDGDTHIDLHVSDPTLVDQANIKLQHGDLVLEQICQGTVTQADAVQACQGVPHDQSIPTVGDTVTVTGTYVLDTVHGWMEIHPVTRLVMGG